MKILVAGCSFAEELPRIISKKIPNSYVKSVAKSAAGNRYISDSVITSTLKEKFDLIYVSWSGLSRYDVVVSESQCFDDWASKNQLHDRTYIFTGGVGGWDHHQHPFATELFRGYHKYVDHEDLYYNSLLEIIKTQGYLKSLSIPYYFGSMINQFVADPTTMVEHDCEYGTNRYPSLKYLIDAIDFDRWIFDGVDGMYEATRRLGLLSKDQFHPSSKGYEYWTDLIVTRLKEDKILY